MIAEGRRLEVCRGDESSDADRLDLRRDTLRLQRGLAVWLIKAAAGVSWRRDCNVTDAKKHRRVCNSRVFLIFWRVRQMRKARELGAKDAV